MKSTFFFKFTGFILFSFFLGAFTTTHSETWKLKKEKNDIKVYTREIENAELDAFKATTEIHTDMESMLAVFKDFEKYTDWVNDCKESFLIEKPEEEAFVYYIRFDTPWPISNRDVVAKLSITEQSPDRTLIEITKVSNRIEEKHKVIRMPEFSASWLLERTGDKVKVTHIGYADPGGRIPKWLANSSVIDGPIETITNLKNILQENK